MGGYDYDVAWRDVYGDIQRHGPAHYHLCRIVKRLLAGIDYASVLDVGCGPGHNYSLLTKEGAVARFDGIDVSERALREARQHFPGRFVQADVQREHLDGCWELVFCSLVLEHLPDDEAAIRHLRKMAGRYLLVTSIVGDFERYRPWELSQGHVRNYRAGELEEKLVAAGFHVVKALYWGFPFYSPLVRTLQNFSTVGTGAYSLGTRLLAAGLRWIYYLNSSRRGDMVFILAQTEHA